MALSWELACAAGVCEVATGTVGPTVCYGMTLFVISLDCTIRGVCLWWPWSRLMMWVFVGSVWACYNIVKLVKTVHQGLDLCDVVD